MVSVRQRLSGFVVTLATLFSSVSGFALVPMTAQAVNYNCPALSAGQYVSYKGQISLLDDESRWVFLNKDAFLTWQASAAKVKTIKYDVCLASFPIGGKIGYRQGSKLLKSGADFYTVAPNNTVHKLGSATVAKTLYGTGYKGLAKPMPADLYITGAGLDEAMVHNGMLVKKKGDKAIWYVSGGKLVMINGKLPAFLSKGVHTVAAATVEGLEVSSDSITGAAIVTDPSQGATPNVADSPVTVDPVDPKITPPTTQTPPATKTTTVNKGLFHDANYTGPFPAPEGIVLLGKYGEDKFWEPTGSGDYRFRVQIAWERDVQCIDGSRTIDKSQGSTWEKGFWQGFIVAASVVKHIDPVFDDTPKGVGAGQKLYDIGYRAGYNYRWGGGTEPRFGCPPKDGSRDMTKYDSDGWLKLQNIDKLKTVKTLFSSIGGVGNSSQSALGGESTSINFDNFIETIESSKYNNSKNLLNLSRIDFLESETSAEELALGPEGIMKALYDQQKAAIQKKYANTVAFIYAEPTIETQTYGKNKITVLQYVTAHDGKWNLVNYGLRIDPKTNVGLLFYFYNPKDISNEAKNGIDVAKASSDYLAQLLTKMEFANY